MLPYVALAAILALPSITNAKALPRHQLEARGQHWSAVGWSNLGGNPTTTTPHPTTTAQTTTTTTTTSTGLPTSTAPPPLDCGDRGYSKPNVNTIYYSNDPINAGFSACKALCLTPSVNAKSFAFGESECLCYGDSVINIISADASSQYVYYDIGCVITSTTTVPPLSATTSTTALIATTTTTQKPIPTSAASTTCTTLKTTTTTQKPTSTSTTTTTKCTTSKTTTTTTTKCTTSKTTTTTTKCTTLKTTTTTTTRNPSLTACPQPLGYIIPGPERSLYAICVDTAYKIAANQVYYNVVDNRACGHLCSVQSGCTKATYNLGTQTCSLQGSPSDQDADWQPSSGFQTLVRIPDGTPITSCPNSYTIVENGVTWTACPATNFFNNPATDIWYGITSEYDCAAHCEATSGCEKFVYNWDTQTCYNKGNPALADTQWTVQTGLGSYYLA